MKSILIYIFIFFLFSISLGFNEEAKLINSSSNSYSLLLDSIRKDLVDKIILNLPKRTEINILQMCLQMSKTKETYNLSDSESVYLIYKWIAQNIEYDCYNVNQGIYENATVPTYNNGKSSHLGISNLFITMCSYFKIKAFNIEGYTKNFAFNFGKLRKKIDHVWNSFLIGYNEYLIDLTMGSGYCDGDKYEKYFSDFYFGTKPEIFVRSHLPKDEWKQVLFEEDFISNEEFLSRAFLLEGFYLNDFKTISPDTEFINLEDKIILTYDETNTNLDIKSYNIYFDGENQKQEDNICKISKGKVEINFNSKNKDMHYVFIAARKSKTQDYKGVAIYKINHNEKKN